MLLCDKPDARFLNWIAEPCLGEMNAEVFASKLDPIWTVLADAVPGVAPGVMSAAEYYFFMYITEEGTLADGTPNPDQFRDSYAEFLKYGKVGNWANGIQVKVLVPLFAATMHVVVHWP